MQSCRGFPNSY